MFARPARILTAGRHKGHVGEQTHAFATMGLAAAGAAEQKTVFYCEKEEAA